VAWTDWEKPFVNFELAWARLIALILDWSDFQPCMVGVGWDENNK